MLIRVRGHNDGIKEYLEKGQKHDREFARDEMDERVILAGDLDLTDALIQSIATDAERYLHITLSFKEDELSREVLAEITRDFEAFMFNAFRPGEYNFYAEAHVPKLKSYADRKTGELVERKVHIHVVVPSENLLTGRRLNPFGKVEQQTRFLEAFQEHVNAKYGLASPRDNRRVAFTDASEMLSRYKGDAFDGANRELKAAILDAMLARDIVRYEDFRALLTEFGQTRTRNAGRGSEYENVKLPGAAQGRQPQGARVLARVRRTERGGKTCGDGGPGACRVRCSGRAACDAWGFPRSAGGVAHGTGARGQVPEQRQPVLQDLSQRAGGRAAPAAGRARIPVLPTLWRYAWRSSRQTRAGGIR